MNYDDTARATDEIVKMAVPRKKVSIFDCVQRYKRLDFS